MSARRSSPRKGGPTRPHITLFPATTGALLPERRLAGIKALTGAHNTHELH